jgi:hypothetical protein
VARKKGDQIALAYKKGSLDPLAKAALAKGGKYLITYYQDEITKLNALVEATDAELAIQLGQLRKWRDRDVAAGNEMAAKESDLKAQYNVITKLRAIVEATNTTLAADAFEKEFWIEELVRYRNWVIELLREKANPPK